MARGFPGWKKFPNPKSTKKQANKKNKARLKSTKVWVNNLDYFISAGQQTHTHTQKVSDKGWCLAVASETSMGSEGLHNVLCDQHFCTLRKWVFAWGNPLWRGTWGHQSRTLIGRCNDEQKLDVGLRGAWEEREVWLTRAKHSMLSNSHLGWIKRTRDESWSNIYQVTLNSARLRPIRNPFSPPVSPSWGKSNGLVPCHADNLQLS